MHRRLQQVPPRFGDIDAVQSGRHVHGRVDRFLRLQHLRRRLHAVLREGKELPRWRALALQGDGDAVERGEDVLVDDLRHRRDVLELQFDDDRFEEFEDGHRAIDADLEGQRRRRHGA